MPEQLMESSRRIIRVGVICALIALVPLGLFIVSVPTAGPPAQAQSALAAKLSTVGQTCVSCHRAYVQSFALEVHGKTAKFLTDSRSATCESCHGDGAKHIANREKRIVADDIDNPTELTTKEARARANDKCLMCHSRDRTRFQWAGGEHDRSDMSCMSCHNVHHAKLPAGILAVMKRSEITGPDLDALEMKQPENMLAAFTVEETCLGCHTDKRKAFNQRSTHMFRTEFANTKVGCTSCHSPHGGGGGKMLVESTANDVCYTCHAEKRGPYLWEHPPARENCMNCHSPHGSNHAKLLTARVHLLCQECHIHMLPRHSTLAGGPLDIWTLNRGCANCHAQVHGSNHPGGRTFTR